MVFHLISYFEDKLKFGKFGQFITQFLHIINPKLFELL